MHPLFTPVRPLLILFSALLLWPAASSADPWQPLNDVDVPSAIRRATYGWILDDFDSGSDPVLSVPVTASAVWANGLVDGDTPIIRTGLDFPVGNALFNLRILAGQSKNAGLDSQLIADEVNADADSFSDLLIWRRSVSGIPDARQDGTLALRAGLRWPTWGLAASFTRELTKRFPSTTDFAFPLTSAPVVATGASTSVFDLGSGERLSVRNSASGLTNEVERVVFGTDFGVRFGDVAMSAGLGFERLTNLDHALGTNVQDVNGNVFSQIADRRFKRNEKAVLIASRFDGRHEVGPDRHVLWSAGLRVRKPRTTEWNGTEALELETSGLAGTLLEEWVREPQLTRLEATRIDAKVGIGLADEGPLFRYGFGVDWSMVNHKQTTGFRDVLTYRVDDRGVINQRPASILNASGYGDWSLEESDVRYEYAIGGGGRYAVTQYLGLLMGSRVGYRQVETTLEQRLVATQAISGQKETDPDVIDPVEVPYANFDIPDEVLREFSNTFIDLNFGFTFHINRADLTTLFTLNDASDLAVIVEGVWRW